jgi:prolycopene isomerase
MDASSELGSRTDKVKKTLFTSNHDGGDDYDLVIVGGGLTGLTTGLLWLRCSDARRVLILEKNHYTGGYVTTFERKGYVFETVQVIGDVDPLLDYLDIHVPMRRFEDCYMRRRVVHADDADEYILPVGPDDVSEMLCERFPSQADGIRRFFAYAGSLYDQVRTLKAVPRLHEKLLTPLAAPKVVSCLSLTFADLLDRFGLDDPRLREVLETFSVFTGVPSGRSSSIQTVGAMITSMTSAQRPRGWFDELPLAMTRKFQQMGGQVRLRAKVERIAVEDGTVRGVRVKDDDAPIRAKRVVTTVDPIVAMTQLVGPEHLPTRYVRRLREIVMSVSSLNVALGLDDDIDLGSLGLDNPYNLLSTGGDTGERLFRGFLAGDNAFGEDCFHLGVVCPSLTTGTRNTVTIRAVPFGIGGFRRWRREDRKRYRAERDRWADFCIERVEEHLIPGLRNHVVVRNVSTPATYARYSGSPTGSIYDMAALVTQFGPRRLPLRTPVANLYQPKFSHGIFGALMNGVQVVDEMLDRSLNAGNSIFAPRR